MNSELICNSKRVVTASLQTALDAKVSGAEVVFIELKELRSKEKELLSSLGITTISGFDVEALEGAFESVASKSEKCVEKSNITVTKIVKSLE